MLNILPQFFQLLSLCCLCGFIFWTTGNTHGNFIHFLGKTSEGSYWLPLCKWHHYHLNFLGRNQGVIIDIFFSSYPSVLFQKMVTIIYSSLSLHPLGDDFTDPPIKRWINFGAPGWFSTSVCVCVCVCVCVFYYIIYITIYIYIFPCSKYLHLKCGHFFFQYQV